MNKKLVKNDGEKRQIPKLYDWENENTRPYEIHEKNRICPVSTMNESEDKASVLQYSVIIDYYFYDWTQT